MCVECGLPELFQTNVPCHESRNTNISLQASLCTRLILAGNVIRPLSTVVNCCPLFYIFYGNSSSHKLFWQNSCMRMGLVWFLSDRVRVAISTISFKLTANEATFHSRNISTAVLLTRWKLSSMLLHHYWYKAPWNLTVLLLLPMFNIHHWNVIHSTVCVIMLQKRKSSRHVSKNFHRHCSRGQLTFNCGPPSRWMLTVK